MPLAGWQVVATTEKLARHYTSHGKEITHAVTDVTWRANTSTEQSQQTQALAT